MKFFADFHIHSKYSRATSKDLDLGCLDKWAKIKGIKVLGTGDFTHPLWFKALREGLEPAENGLFKLKKSSLYSLARSGRADSETRFILTAEISCIYSKNDKVRKIHILVFSPSFEICEKINAQLGELGNLKADGRPILGLDAKELAKIVLDISADCLIVPAHCLTPETYIHTDKGIKMIKDVKERDFVYTHKGRIREVKKIYKRHHKGQLYNIRPYYFRIGLQTTSEHPFYIIKTHKNCSNFGRGKHVYCRKTCGYIKNRICSHHHFENYKPQWVQAKDIEKGDVLIFPKFADIKDKEILQLDKILNPIAVKYNQNRIAPIGHKVNWISNIIKTDKDFCRLAGYYLAEGYTNSRDAIGFSFRADEREYINDVRFLMDRIFGLQPAKIRTRKSDRGIEIIYYSKILENNFRHLFYSVYSGDKKANTKAIPDWMLELPLKKQVEIFKGWWRGDMGCTSSRFLMNQMKIICIRLGIIPSIAIFKTKESFNKGEHRIGYRTIKANHDMFRFSNLSFFEDRFGLLKDACFKKFNTKLTRKHGWIDKKYIYIPVRDIETKDYEGEVYNLEVEEDNSYVSEFATIHNCWTPWFSVFGSKSGFNSLEECFGDYTKYIYAGETGLSSDPAMNWRLSQLDKISLISNSDAHSPQKIGREANAFDTEISYSAIADAIKTKNPSKFLYTVEFFPEEGKYHYDGHRLCGVRTSPEETKKYKNICPVCAQPLTIGVLNRVEELADRPKGFKPEGAIPFKNLVPLQEIIADAFGQLPGTKRVAKEYQKLIESFGNEFKILLDVAPQDLRESATPEVAEGIIKVREGKVVAEPGYDGVFGKIRAFNGQQQKQTSKQKALF